MQFTPTRREALIASLATGLATLLPSRASAAGTWKMAPPLPRAMGEVVGANVGRSTYVFGGLDDAAGEVPVGAAYRFNAETGRWSGLERMPQPAHHLMSTIHAGKIYIFGGFTLPAAPALARQLPQPPGDIRSQIEGLERRAAHECRSARLCRGIHRKQAACVRRKLSIRRDAGNLFADRYARGLRSQLTCMISERVSRLRDTRRPSGYPARTTADKWRVRLLEISGTARTLSADSGRSSRHADRTAPSADLRFKRS